MDKTQQLIVEVYSGRDLISMDDNGLSDPYVIVDTGVKKGKTKVIRESLNPNWQVGFGAERFSFTHKNIGKTQTITFLCMDWDRFKADDRMGQVVIKLGDTIFKDGKTIEGWFKLVPQKSGDAVSGELQIKISLKKIQKKKKHSPFWKAVVAMDFATFENLLRKNQEWDERGEDGDTILHMAMKPRQSDKEWTEDAERILLQLIKEPKCDVMLVDDEGNTPLHTFCKSFKSPSCEDHFQALIDRGAKVNAQNKHGETPLHYAVFNPCIKVIMAELLLKNKADPDIPTKSGDTCVHYAVDIGKVELIKLFIIYDANFNIMGSQGQKPLVMAKSNKSLHSSIQDSLELARWLRANGWSEYVTKFLNEELYTFILAEMGDESALSGVVEDKETREKIIEKAKNIKVLNRAETFLRKQAHFQKIAEDRKKENELREELQKSIMNSDCQQVSWEIDINDLEFSTKLGVGTSGEVFKGQWKGKNCAIKVLKATNNAKEMEEFIREFSVMINVKSPHIVQFYGASLREKLTMVMELCDRGSLFHVLQEKSITFSWPMFFEMMEEIVKGIQCLHNNIPILFHRDLKTLNVLVTQDFHCRVADFGLSRFVVNENQITLNKCRGTAAYVAPEVFDSKGFQKESDIYSLSMILWELTTRLILGEYQKPFGEYKALKLEFQILVAAGKQGKRCTIKPGTPELIEKLIKDTWQVQYELRGDCETFLARLQECKEKYESDKKNWDNLVKNKI